MEEARQLSNEELYETVKDFWGSNLPPFEDFEKCGKGLRADDKKKAWFADRGVGGEKETAMRMYEELKARYEIEDEEIMLDTVSLHWFGYNGELEEDLLTQIFYKVTGSASYHAYTGKYKRRRKEPRSTANIHTTKRNTDKEAQNMGRRKNRHCQSKQEVINRELLKRQQSGSRTKNTAINQLHTINQLRPAMEQARNTMREKNRRESKNDIV